MVEILLKMLDDPGGKSEQIVSSGSPGIHTYIFKIWNCKRKIYSQELYNLHYMGVAAHIVA